MVATILWLQALHIIVLSFFFYPMSADVLCASGAISLVLYSSLLHREVLRDPFGISPFILYLFVAWVRLGLIPIYQSAVVALDHVDKLAFAGYYDTSAHYIPGYHLELLGDWFFLVGYFSLRRFSSPLKPFQFINPAISPMNLLRSAYFLIAVVYAMRLSQYFGTPLTRFGQIYQLFKAYGPAAILLTLIFAIKKLPPVKRRPIILLTAILFFADFYVAMDSYMKQHVMVVLLPLFIYFFITIRTSIPGFRPRIFNKRLAVIAVTSFISLSILFTYSEMRRGDFWGASRVMNDERPEISSYLVHALGSLNPWSETFSAIHRFPKNGAWYLIYRNDLLVGDAWCYETVQREGTTHGIFFKEIPAVLIPRLLWPEKPMVSYGRNIAVRLGQAYDVESATTATVFSMAGGFYWAWGYPCVVIGMFLNGMAFYLAWKTFSSSIILNPISSLVCTSLFLGGLRHFEGVFDGNIVDYILIFAVFLPLSRLWDAHITKGKRWRRKGKIPILRSKHQYL